MLKDRHGAPLANGDTVLLSALISDVPPGDGPASIRFQIQFPPEVEVTHIPTFSADSRLCQKAIKLQGVEHGAPAPQVKAEGDRAAFAVRVPIEVRPHTADGRLFVHLIANNVLSHAVEVPTAEEQERVTSLLRQAIESVCDVDANAELSAIDSLLSGRLALDGLASRWVKIQHALNTAKRADELEAELGRVDAQLAKIPQGEFPQERLQKLNEVLLAAVNAKRLLDENEVLNLRLAGALVAAEGGEIPPDSIEAIRNCPTIKAVQHIRKLADDGSKVGNGVILALKRLGVDVDLTSPDSVGEKLASTLTAAVDKVADELLSLREDAAAKVGTTDGSQPAATTPA